MKMECPKCSQSITSLKYEVIDCKTLEYGTFSLKRGYPVYVKEEIVDSDFSQYLYSCPRCGQVVFDTPEEAYQFLSKNAPTTQEQKT